MSNNKTNHENEQLDNIKEFGIVKAIEGRHKIFCLNIIGEIEGHSCLPENTKTTKYEHIIPQLVAVEQDNSIEGMLIILNTIGGDVEAGLALAELISGMKNPTVSFVLGGGHSIGVPLAVSAKCSFIAPSATMTIHPVRTSGLVIGVPQTMNHFARMQGRITDFVVKNSGITSQKFTELMMNTGELVTDVGTTLSGEQAVNEKLIDRVGKLDQVLDCLYQMIDSN